MKLSERVGDVGFHWDENDPDKINVRAICNDYSDDGSRPVARYELSLDQVLKFFHTVQAAKLGKMIVSKSDELEID